MSSRVERLELSTESDELVILERLDDRDIAIAIMGEDGEETRARIRASALQLGLTTIGAGA